MADNSSTVVLYSQLGELLEKKLGTDLFNSVGNFISSYTDFLINSNYIYDANNLGISYTRV